MRRILSALCAALLLCALCASAASAASEPEKIYVLLSDKLGYDPQELLDEVPTVEEAGVEVKASVLRTGYKSEHAKTAEIDYFDNGDFKKLSLTGVACADGKIERLEYWYDREFWSYGDWEDDGLSVRYGPTGRLMEYSGWLTKDVYCRFDGFGEPDYVDSNSNPDMTAEDLLASDLPLPELVGDPFDCGLETLAPQITLYAQFPELGIDLRAALDAVPEPGALMLMNVNGFPYVVLEDADHVYTDVTFQFDGDFWTSSASHFSGSATLEDYWLLGEAYQHDFDRKTTLMLSSLDAQGNRVTAFWERTYDEEADMVSLEKLDRLIVRFPEANDHGFTSLEADLATGERTLRCASGDLTLEYNVYENVRCEANYGASGALTGYRYKAYDGVILSFDGYGALAHGVRYDERRMAFYPPLAVDGELPQAPAWVVSSDWGLSDERLALYPPLEIAGGDNPVPPPAERGLAPDEKVFARIEDTGFDRDALLALAPQEAGIAVDGATVTVADQGYSEVWFYGFAGEEGEFVEREGALADGVWTIDCAGIELEDGAFWLSGEETDAQGRWISLEWTLGAELTMVQLSLPEPDENGVTGLYASLESGDAGVFTANVEAFYDEDGNLFNYNYYAADGSYCMFNNYFELADVLPADWQ